jgi:predicted ATP-dependent serine protease
MGMDGEFAGGEHVEVGVDSGVMFEGDEGVRP